MARRTRFAEFAGVHQFELRRGQFDERYDREAPPVRIAGFEAQKNDSEPSEIGMPPEQEDGAASASEEQETDLKLHLSVGLD